MFFFPYLKLFALLLKLVELGGAEDVGPGLHQFRDNVQRVVDGTIVLVHVILDLLKNIKISEFSVLKMPQV